MPKVIRKIGLKKIAKTICIIFLAMSFLRGCYYSTSATETNTDEVFSGFKIEKVFSSADNITINFTNQSDNCLCIDGTYLLEKRESNIEWEYITSGKFVDSEIFLIEPGKEINRIVHWKNFLGSLEPGEYRIRMNISLYSDSVMSETKPMEIYFQVEDTFISNEIKPASFEGFDILSGAGIVDADKVIYPTVRIGNCLYEWRRGSVNGKFAVQFPLFYETETTPNDCLRNMNYYGTIIHSLNDSPMIDCELVSWFDCKGAIYVDENSEDTVYLFMSTPWISYGVIAFDKVNN